MGYLLADGFSSARLLHLVNRQHVEFQTGILSKSFVTQRTHELRFLIAFVPYVLFDAVFSFVFFTALCAAKLTEVVHVEIVA